MSNWPVKKLSEICDINPKKAEINDFSEDTIVSFVPMTSVNEYSQSIIIQEDKELSKVKNGYTYFRRGDILFAKITPCMENGKVAHAKNLKNEIGFGSTEFHVLRTGNEVLPEYVYLLVSSSSFRLEAETKMTGSAGQKRVPKDFIENYEIPVPSVEEQRAIVKILEDKLGKVKEAIELRKEAMVDTEKIVSSKINEIFSEGREKYFGVYLDKLATLVRGPFGGSLTKQMFTDKGYAVYEQGNVIGDQVNNFRYFVSENKYNEMFRFSVKSGDILMSCSGTIGKFTYIKNDYIEGIINQALLKITPNLDQVSREYLQYALIDYLKNSIGHIKGAAIKNIVSVKELKKIKIPVPDLDTQNEIVRKIEDSSLKISELGKLQESQLADLNALEQAYLHEAFSGELV